MQLYPHEEYLVHQDKRVHKEHLCPHNALAISPQNLKCVWDLADLAPKKERRNR